MPLYRYECANPGCTSGGEFEVVQSIREDALETCPACGGAVSRLINPVALTTPTGDTKLKDLGFAKLVRRDKGVYENVTAMDHESRYFRAGRPETMPDIKKRVGD